MPLTVEQKTELDALRAKVGGGATGIGPSPLSGELGTLRRPDGSVSTEISITVTDPRLNQGRPTNIPSLVQGQTGVNDLLAGKRITPEQQNIAIQRAIDRTRDGLSLPSFGTIEEAVAAAKARSQSKAGGAAAGLTAEQTRELQVLRAKQGGLSPESQLQLIDQLRGTLPLSQTPRTGLPIQKEALMTNPQKEKAFNQLLQSGITKEQIQTVLDIQKRADPSIISQIKQNIGEDVGGLIGGIGGAKAALAVGQIPPFTALPEEFVTVPLFAAAGAFLAGGIGKNIQQTVDPLGTPSVKDFIRSGTRQALFEAGGREVSAATRLLPIFKKPLKESQEVAELFARKGGFFTPKQRDTRIITRSLEELSRGSFGGSDVFEGFDIGMQAKALEVGKEIVDTIARDAVKDPSVLGDELVEIFSRAGERVGARGIVGKGIRETLLDDFFEPLYKEVGRLSPGTRLSTLPIKRFMEKKLKDDLAQGGALLTREGRSKFRFTLKNLKTQRTLNQMVDLRSSYLKDARKFRVGADKSDVAFFELAEVADKALFDPSTVAGMTPEGKKLLRNINAVYGPAREIYSNEFIKSVINRLGTSPSNVTKVVYKDFDFGRLKGIRDLLIRPIPKESGIGQTSKNIQRELRTLRNTLPGIKGGEEAARLIGKNAAEGRALWRQLNAAWFAEQLKINPTTGILNVGHLNKVIDDIPDKTFRLMFPGASGKGIKDIQKLFNVLAPGKRGFVSMFGKTIELGGISGISGGLVAGSGIAVTAGGALVIAPTAFAKLATNPKATKALTLGLTARRGSVRIAPIAARLINLLNEDARKEQLEILKERRQKRPSPIPRITQTQLKLGGL